MTSAPHHSHDLQASGVGSSVRPALNSPGYILPGASSGQDENHWIRTSQSRLCQLAWIPLSHCQKEVEELSTLFDQEIRIRCCLDSCRRSLFPELANSNSGSDPTVLFHDSCASNRDLFLSIERGECPCRFASKTTIAFLPACAAAAAGNVDLFRRMLETFVTQMQRRGGDRDERGGVGGRSALKTGRAASHVRKALRFDISLAAFHSDRLLAQGLRHLMYVNQSREALRVLDDPRVQSVIPLTDDSKISLMDLALRVGDEDTFLALLDRWGPNVQSDADGYTPLLVAVSGGWVEVARAVLRRGARRGAATRGGRSALQQAFRLKVLEERDKMVLMLMDEGEGRSDPDHPHVPSALELAIQHNCYALLDYLIERGHVRVPELFSGRIGRRLSEQVLWSPVVSWCCVRHGNYSTARYLIDKGLDCLSPVLQNLRAVIFDSRTPLQALVAQTSDGADGLVDLLIEKGADVNERTANGYTPLVLAVQCSNLKVLGKLLCAGAILDSPQSDDRSENGEAGSVVNASESASAQGGSGLTTAQNSTIPTPNGTIPTPNSTIPTPNGTIPTPNGTIPTPNSTIPTPNGFGSAQTGNDSGSAPEQNGPGSVVSLLQCRSRTADPLNASLLWHALHTNNFRVAEMAVVGGYRAQREAWYVKGDFPPHTPKHVRDNLQRISRQPMTLISLCRRTVRESVGSELPVHLHYAHLPQVVTDFILMKDLIDMYLE